MSAEGKTAEERRAAALARMSVREAETAYENGYITRRTLDAVKEAHK